MKIKYYKSYFKKPFSKIVLISLALLIAFAAPIQIFQKASADEYDDKIAALGRDIAKYNEERARLKQEATTLQSAISQLAAQKAAIQAEIDVSQAKFDQLTIQIADTEKKIQDSRDALGFTIADMYVEDNITPIEMLASSNSIGDYLDKQEYRSSVRSELTASIAKIKELKTQLDKQKTDIEIALLDQRNAKSELERKNQETQSLLSKTNGEESSYQQLVANAQSEIDRVTAAQASWRATLLGGSSEYSKIWNDSNCIMGSPYNINIPGYYSWIGADGNGGDGYGYGCRQCVSYAMWRVYLATGHYYRSWGDPVYLSSSAAGIFNYGSTPKVGSLGIMSAWVAGNDGQGHVVWVEKVNDNGTLEVSQYNANINGIGYGNYSRVIVSASLFYEYIYIVE